MNITLPDDLKKKIEDAVKDTDTDIEDFVREAIEAQLKEEAYLREKIQEGLDSGKPEPWDAQDIIRRGHERLETRKGAITP
ncbi:MAG: ribbon-helix-helix protein, CopG family [Candidatus Omnitrophota bacterium]